MGKSAIRAGGLIAVVLGTIGIINAVGASYLPKTGPAGLRFQPARSQIAIQLPPPGIGQSPATDGANGMGFQNPPFKNAPNITLSGFLLPGSTLLALFNGINAEDAPLKPGIFASQSPPEISTANDLLVITPQMLIDYFKPVPGSTNGAGVSVLIPVNFTPPTAPAETHSSSATYKVQ